MPVSSDTAIAIAFGLLGTIISLLGLLVGYLTLRAMPTGMLISSSSSVNHNLPQSICLTRFVKRKTKVSTTSNLVVSIEYIATNIPMSFHFLGIRMINGIDVIHKTVIGFGGRLLVTAMLLCIR
jgi:hypothetical protein